MTSTARSSLSNREKFSWKKETLSPTFQHIRIIRKDHCARNFDFVMRNTWGAFTSSWNSCSMTPSAKKWLADRMTLYGDSLSRAKLRKEVLWTRCTALEVSLFEDHEHTGTLWGLKSVVVVAPCAQIKVTFASYPTLNTYVRFTTRMLSKISAVPVRAGYVAMRPCADVPRVWWM